MGVARASQLANRRPVSWSTLQRMSSYFARHAVDASGDGWGKDGKGWQAWLLWGGDAGRAWAKRVLDSKGDDVAKGNKTVRGLWGSTAGKTRVAGRVVDMIPTHKVYVEPFAGGGAVLYRKGRIEGTTEVVCDANPEVAFSFAFARDATDDQVAKLAARDWIVSRPTAKAVHELQPADDVERFYRFTYKRFALFFRNETRITAIDPSKEGKAATIPLRLPAVKDRLAGLQVHTGDYRPVLAKYDGPDTFYYLDPPYPQCRQDVGEEDFSETDFIGVLRKMRGKFLLHYDARALDVFKAVGREEGWIVRTVPVSATGGHTQGHKAAMLLEVLNYLPDGPPVATGVVLAFRSDADAKDFADRKAKAGVHKAADVDDAAEDALVAKAGSPGAADPWEGADEEALLVLLAKRKSPLRVMGTLEPFFKRLLSWLPDHDTYVEPFGGPAELLFEKPAAKVEVINDLDDRTADFWKSLKALSDPDLDWLERQEWIRKRDVFLKLRDAPDTPGRGLIWKIMYCTACNLRPIGGQFKNYRNDSDGSPINVWKRLRPAVKRLADVAITSEDFAAVVAKYDAPNTFFYMDPPFHGTGGYYRTDLDDGGHQRIYQTVAKLKGKAMVWNTANAHVIKLIKDAGLDYRVLRKPGLLHRMTGNGKKWNYFVLASNYDLGDMAKSRGATPVAKGVGLSAQPIYKAPARLDYAEGDAGVGVLQTHERGLAKLQVDMLPGLALGWNTTEVTDGDMDRLAKLADGDWPAAVKAAQDGKPAALAKLVQAGVDKGGLSDEDALLLAQVRPVQIATDMRLRRVVPDKDDHWQGGPVLTPGNQHRPNALLAVAQAKPADKAVPADFRVPTAEALDGEGDAPIRGDLEWMTLGADGKPAVLGPKDDGSPAGYSRVTIRDVFKWQAGVQRADFKEFWFDGSWLKGRWLAVQRPVGPGGSKAWAWARPVDQQPESEGLRAALKGQPGAPVGKADTADAADAAVPKALVARIIKAKDELQIVTGLVLVPDVVDSQGDVISADAIAKAAHDFVQRYGTDTKIGLQHKDFSKDLRLVESYIAPVDMVLGDEKIPAGSWLMSVKVLDAKVWQGVKNGQIRGFSIGGTAQQVRALAADATQGA